MNRIFPLALLLGGCPYIPGKWSDYDVPDETTLIGRFDYYEPIGGYWDDSDPSGIVAFAWLEDPQIGLTALTTQRGCELVDLEAEPEEPFDLLDLEADDARIRSSLGSIDIPYDRETRVFGAELTDRDAGSGVAWTLDAVDSTEGSFFVPEFIVMPPRLEFSGLPIDGDAPEGIDRGPLTISWQPEEDAAFVHLVLVLEGEGGTIREIVTCMVDATARTVTVPEDTWDDLDGAVGMYVDLGSVNETASRVEGAYGASRMSAGWYQKGYLRLE